MVLHGFGKVVINRVMLDITRLVGRELNRLLVYISVPFNVAQNQPVINTLKGGTQNFYAHASKLPSLYQVYLVCFSCLH